MAKVSINFIGPLKIFLGAQTITVDINNIDEAKEYVDAHYGPAYQKKLDSMGVNKKLSIWDSSVFLLNGRNLRKADNPALNDGDHLDLVLLVAGG